MLQHELEPKNPITAVVSTRDSQFTMGFQAGYLDFFQNYQGTEIKTEILCVSQPSQAPQSRFFLASVFSADYDDSFTLVYSFMAVELRAHILPINLTFFLCALGGLCGE